MLPDGGPHERQQQTWHVIDRAGWLLRAAWRCTPRSPTPSSSGTPSPRATSSPDAKAPNRPLRSTLLGTRHALPHLIKGGGGSVVNTASVAGLVGDVLQIAYGAVKAAVINITKSIAVQYGPQRVRCNAVAPGAVVTPALLGNLPEEVVESLERVNALPYLGDPEDIGHTMVFLASDESRYMTGQLLVVDGGMTIRSPAAQGRQDMLPPSS
ncbi:SDR family oxidoreductase [Nonomuraea sp. NPDC049607]|uniref:SDR family NAD(P)-dependent oxidoreductase n=1 Tax=Nonomuraea sp. NPDC049607 TaxID=3154732 RepID=UPI003412AFE2